MLFSAHDKGSRIEAYAIPDDFSGRPVLNLYVEGELLKTLEPNVTVDGALSRHETGRVGFTFDDSMIVGLESIPELEIREAATGVLIFRRTLAPVVPHSLFRLETQLFPLWRLDQAVKPHFRYWFDRIEKHTMETATQILHYYTFGSVYSSGRLPLPNYDYCLYERQKSAVMIQDPFEELAERLMLFNRLGADANRLLNERDAMIFAPILELAQTFRSFDEAEFRRVLGKADIKTLALLNNPLARQLTVRTPSDPVERNAVGKSLKMLSEFDIVGTREHADIFTNALGELLDIAPEQFPIVERTKKVRQVARTLRAVRWVEGLLEYDLEIYAHLTHAFQSTS